MSFKNVIPPEQLSNIIKPGAAGLLVMNDKQEFLLMKRTPKAKVYPAMWSVPSGVSNVNEFESMEDCARREFLEETTYQIPKTIQLYLVDRYFTDDRLFFLFICRVPKRFFVKIDFEHTEVGWFTKNNLPEPITPEVLDAINRV